MTPSLENPPRVLIQMQANSQSHLVAAAVVDKILLLPTTQCLDFPGTKTLRQVEVKRLRRGDKGHREQQKKQSRSHCHSVGSAVQIPGLAVSKSRQNNSPVSSSYSIFPFWSLEFDFWKGNDALHR